MIKGHNVVRLEQALQSWENTCFLPAMILRYGTKEAKAIYRFELSGAIANYQKLRIALLHTSDKFNVSDYLGNEAYSYFMSEMEWLPLDLFLWTRLSRRVFQYSSDLQTLLSAISLERVTWDMVNFPFASFVVALPEPLNDGLGWEFDCILFSDVTYFFTSEEEAEEGKKVFHLILFSTNLDNSKFITPEIRSKMQKAISRKHYYEFSQFVEKYYPGVENEADVPKVQNARDCFVEVLPKENESVLETLDRQIKKGVDTEDMYQVYSVIGKALHQVVAFCLYLDSLRPVEKGKYIESVKLSAKAEKARDLKAIADASEIFTVKCEHYLSNEDKAVINEIRRLRKEGGTKCVHWRRGFCRRMPGKGNDPDAPKIVIVKPTLVNAKLLKPDTLPAGSKAILT